jgi:hypothetical protein
MRRFRRWLRLSPVLFHRRRDARHRAGAYNGSGRVVRARCGGYRGEGVPLGRCRRPRRRSHRVRSVSEIEGGTGFRPVTPHERSFVLLAPFRAITHRAEDKVSLVVGVVATMMTSMSGFSATPIASERPASSRESITKARACAGSHIGV